ncbi:hypothetical protein [Sphingomonas sp.]|uniref:hypothetical protein n=1 Tax=Sphingomonas sp. TaxID=28214 RepID=UPI0017BFB8E4|nr:hypothetical protein [Sphingomonas sp.]MBA4761198.1 hypothetical protein [Sphingomonas sp.]
MAFREKIAWVSFLSTVLIWGAFFVILALVPHQARGLAMLGPFIVATVAQAAVMIAAATIWAISAPKEANAPADERDRAVGRRATGIAYFTLILGLVGVIVWLHFGLHGPDTIFALAGAFILAEAVRFGATALGYRKGV